MAGQDTGMTRITRAFGTVTSIFRCHGLQYIPKNADSVGSHDVFYWCAFLGIMSAWFLFIYAPQCRRVERLQGHQQALALQLTGEQKELARLDQGIGDLKRGDALAWERAARARLGWLQPGETLDASKLSRIPYDIAQNSGRDPNRSMQSGNNAPLPPLPRPRVPRIPQAGGSPPAMYARGTAQPRVQFADSGTLGPTASRPPAPPPAPALPSLPPRPSLRSTPLSTTAMPVNAPEPRAPVRTVAYRAGSR